MRVLNPKGGLFLSQSSVDASLKLKPQKMSSDGKHKHKHLRPHSKFAVGSDIEVTSDEEGFRGIWFPAKILALPSKARKHQYFVEYKSLLAEENGTNLLTEHAHRSFIRPALTTEEGDKDCFEVSDVVEAFHLDGWWIGAVVSVLGDQRYRVCFNNPADELVFERSSLRIHKDWVDGKWILPPKKEKKLTDTNFIALIDGKWVSSSQDPALNIEAQFSLPPGNSIDLNKCAEDFRSGQEDEQSFPSERDNVDNGSTPLQIEQATDVQLPANIDIHGSDNREDNPFNGNSPGSWIKLAGEGKNYVSSTKKKSSSKRRRKEKLIDTLDPEIITPRKPTAGKDQLEKENATEHLQEEEDFIDEGTTDSSLKTHDKSNVDDTKELTGGNESLRKSRRQKKSVYESCILALQPAKKKQKLIIKPLSSSLESESSPNCAAEIEANLKCIAEPEPESNNGGGDINDDDKPLSRPIADSCSPPMVVDSTQTDGGGALVPNGTIATITLPFTKISPIWKVVEEMEVLKQIPQNPHFKPLYEAKEDCREGTAIGFMVTFSNLVQKISRFGLGDPKSLLDDSMDTLPELESHGFDVEPLRARLTELISIKTRCECSQHQCNDIEKKIVGWQIRKAKDDEEIKRIDSMIDELMMKRDCAVRQIEEKEAEIEVMELEMQALKGGFEEAGQEFERLVKKPW